MQVSEHPATLKEILHFVFALTLSPNAEHASPHTSCILCVLSPPLTFYVPHTIAIRVLIWTDLVCRCISVFIMCFGLGTLSPPHPLCVCSDFTVTVMLSWYCCWTKTHKTIKLQDQSKPFQDLIIFRLLVHLGSNEQLLSIRQCGTWMHRTTWGTVFSVKGLPHKDLLDCLQP